MQAVIERVFQWSDMRCKPSDSDRLKIAFLLFFVLVNTFLQYETKQTSHHFHLFFQELYFVPLILASFWFGLFGAVATSLLISAMYLPFIVLHWNQFSFEDFCRVSSIVIYNGIALILGSLRDRERIKQLRIRETENLAAMGRALSAAAHDFKTPLIAIGGFSNLVSKDLAQCKCGGHEVALDRLGIIVKETGRLENLVKDMLDFARPLRLELCTEELNRILERSVSVCESSALERHVQLVRQLFPCPLHLSIDCGRAEQAVINLLINAIQVSPENESVSIRSYKKGRFAVLEIADHGTGIPEDKRIEVFTPFFTTRKDGTGLGLPIARKIIEAHKGALELLDNGDTGIIARVSLPLQAPQQL